MGGYLRLTVCLEHLTVLIIIKRVFALYGSPVSLDTGGRETTRTARNCSR